MTSKSAGLISWAEGLQREYLAVAGETPVRRGLPFSSRRCAVEPLEGRLAHVQFSGHGRTEGSRNLSRLTASPSDRMGTCRVSGNIAGDGTPCTFLRPGLW